MMTMILPPAPVASFAHLSVEDAFSFAAELEAYDGEREESHPFADTIACPPPSAILEEDLPF